MAFRRQRALRGPFPDAGGPDIAISGQELSGAFDWRRDRTPGDNRASAAEGKEAPGGRRVDRPGYPPGAHVAPNARPMGVQSWPPTPLG